MRFFYLLLLAPFAAIASEHYASGDAPQAVIQAYSRAAHLLPLSGPGEDALRVWTRDYMTGQVQGYIMTKTIMKSCGASSSYADGSITIGRVRCGPSSKPSALGQAIQALPAFRRKEWTCPAFDGYEVFIEGVRQHKYFVVRVANPQACDGPGSKAIVELLGKLG
jgi:hypothetical protein